MPEFYDNRELSWLKFNHRVLEEAENLENPLFERLRFLAIVANNLDEFYMVRVGSMHDQILLEKPADNKTGMSVREQLDAVYLKTQKHNKDRDKAFEKLAKELKDKNVHFLRPENLSSDEKEMMKQYFDQEVMPLLSPQVVDPKHPFPFLANRQSYIIVQLNLKNRKSLGIIAINRQFLKPLVFIPGKKAVKFMRMEDLILMFAQRVFRDMNIEGRSVVRIIRNADLDAEEAYYDEDIDYREFMKMLIKKRSKLRPVRVEFSEDVPKELKAALRKRLKLTASQMFIVKSPLSFEFIAPLEEKLHATHRDSFFYPQLTPQVTPYAEPNTSIMRQILDHDIFISYPFQNTTPVLKLLQEAALDKKVVAIKIALYRVASESKIIAALTEAAENGKDVVVAMELKARFDEENNINWSDKLEDAGCKVIYGVDYYKVHSKIMVILRKDGNLTQTFTHVSSGNYNEKTSRLYTDVNLITANREIGEDALEFFNLLQLAKISDANDFTHFLASPMGIKARFIALIQEEIKVHALHGDGHIFFKMNSLTDKDVLDTLVEASKAGVKVDLLVRGICCQIPGIPGVSENIRVRSIIGRFLEHSRIYYFHAHGEEKMYISSADLMTRNTEKRVELACPVYDSKIKEELKTILAVGWKDNVNVRVMDEQGEYKRMKKEKPAINSQLQLYQRAYREAEKDFPEEFGLEPIPWDEITREIFQKEKW